MKSVEYLNVRADIVEEVGAEAAWVYAYLCYASKYLPKDEYGYFCLDLAHVVDLAHVTDSVRVSRRKFMHCRDKLADRGLIAHTHGANQNCKPRYKLL